MIFKSVSEDEFYSRKKKAGNGKLQQLIRDFVESGQKVCEIQIADGEYNHIGSEVGTINHAARNMKMDNTVRAVRKEGKSFIYRADLLDEE